MKTFNTDIIKAVTPLILMLMGGVLGAAVIITGSANPKLSDVRFQLEMAFAATMVTVGATLAQGSKNEGNFSVTKKGSDLTVDNSNHDCV